MPRKLSPEKQLELDRLYRVLSVIDEWYDALAPRTPETRMAPATRAAYEERDLPGLRMAYNDMAEMLTAATAQQRRELDALLRARANTTIESLTAKQRQRVDRIRARGRLTSEEQYYLVREHVEFCFDDPDRAEEVAQLVAMMNDYGERMVARRRAQERSDPLST